MAHGRPSISTIRELLPRADHDAEDREVERMEIEDVEGSQLCPGAAELLRALPANRYAIVTSATRPLAEVRLRAAGLPVPENLVTARDAKRGKPNPDPYLMGGENPGRPTRGMRRHLRMRRRAFLQARRPGGTLWRCARQRVTLNLTGRRGLDCERLLRTLRGIGRARWKSSCSWAVEQNSLGPHKQVESRLCQNADYEFAPRREQ